MFYAFEVLGWLDSATIEANSIEEAEILAEQTAGDDVRGLRQIGRLEYDFLSSPTHLKVGVAHEGGDAYYNILLQRDGRNPSCSMSSNTRPATTMCAATRTSTTNVVWIM